MTKEDFLNGLRTSLSGTVSADIINDNMNYYEEYINTEIRRGRSEEEVLGELGDPRLIAKTIAETAPEEGKRGPEVVDEDGNSENEIHERDRTYLMPWWEIVIIIMVLIGIVLLAGTIIGAILPVLIPVIIAAAVVYMLRRR